MILMTVIGAEAAIADVTQIIERRQFFFLTDCLRKLFFLTMMKPPGP